MELKGDDNLQGSTQFEEIFHLSESSRKPAMLTRSKQSAKQSQSAVLTPQ